VCVTQLKTTLRVLKTTIGHCFLLYWYLIISLSNGYRNTRFIINHNWRDCVTSSVNSTIVSVVVWWLTGQRDRVDAKTNQPRETTTAHARTEFAVCTELIKSIFRGLFKFHLTIGSGKLVSLSFGTCYWMYDVFCGDISFPVFFGGLRKR